jgi:hypothetical protein
MEGDIAAEIARLTAEYAKAAGIDRVKVLEKLRDAFFADPTVFFDSAGGILAPADWPEEAKMLFVSYSAGTATAAEKIVLADRIKLGFDLLDEIRPLGPAD